MRLKVFIIKAPEMSIERGWGNGYIIIPAKTIATIQQLEDISSPHGGFTYTELVEDSFVPEYIKADKDDMVLGFDTAHYLDDSKRWTKEAVMIETKRIALRIEEYLNNK